jgi:pantoate--beta-alanine ligase
MGYLHEGHLSLIRTARKKADAVFVSIFVNPLQFGPGEDYSRYPRNFKRDENLCRQTGVDYVFYPPVKELYPERYSTYVNVDKITETLEGEIRPGHFKGVATVVLKLFNIIQPHFSVFGQKDAQQVCVIKKMAEELNINSKIIVNPTVREKDGLAMSSRNVYLNKEQRKDAAVLYKSLKFARDNLKTKKITNLRTIKKKMYSVIKSRQSVTKIDYISFNNNSNLEVIKSVKDMKKGSELLISLAVRFGRIRLIDNIVIKY